MSEQEFDKLVDKVANIIVEVQDAKRIEVYVWEMRAAERIANHVKNLKQ